MDLDNPDPFTMVLNRLWALLEADADFCAAVQPGNRIKFTVDSQGNPIKENVQLGDLPEVIIEPTTGSDNLASTSGAGKAEITYRIMVATGDMRVLTANLMHWILWRIFDHAGDRLTNTNVAGLGDMGFVYKSRFSTIVSATLNPEISRGRKGWCVLLTITTTLELPRGGS